MHRLHHRCYYFHQRLTHTHTYAEGESLSCAVMKVLSRCRRLPRTTLALLSCGAARLSFCPASGGWSSRCFVRNKKEFYNDLSSRLRGTNCKCWCIQLADTTLLLATRQSSVCVCENLLSDRNIIFKCIAVGQCWQKNNL